MPATYYPAVIDRSASGFGVTFPDFPGCIANGATVNEAAVQAERALAFHVEALVADKDKLPEPSALDAIEDVDGADDVARLMVRIDAPAKVARVLVSIDENLLRAIDGVASNRSAFLADAARAALYADAHGIQLRKAPDPQPSRPLPRKAKAQRLSTDEWPPVTNPVFQD